MKTASIMGALCTFLIPLCAAGQEETRLDGGIESTDEAGSAEIDSSEAGLDVEYAKDALEDNAGDAEDPGAIPAGPVNLSGLVLERGSRKPVSDITVYIKDTELSAQTDEKGRFEFRSIPEGDWVVVIPTTEYEKFETTEKMVKGEKITVKYYLEPRVYGALEVVVRDKKIEKEVSRTVMSIEEAKLIPGTFGDPVRSIESMPGVARGGGGGGDGLVIRGSNAEDSSVFLDGHEVPSLFHFGGIKSIYNAKLIDEFTLYTGGFSSQYGLATGGVVTMKSRNPRMDRFGGYVDLSMIDASAMVEGPIGDKLGIALAARRSTTDLLMAATGVNDKIEGFKFTTYPVYYDYQSKFNYKLDDKNQLSLDFYGGYDGVAAKMDTVIDSEPGMTGYTKMSWSFENAFVHWRFDNGAIESDFSPGYMHIREQTIIGQYFIKDHIHIMDVNEDLRFNLHKTNTLAAGVKLQPRWIRLEANLVRPPKEGDVGFSFANAEPIKTDLNDSDIVTSAYIQDEMTFGPVLFVPGVRFDHESLLNAYSFGPRALVRWQVIKPLALKASGGMYSRIPDPDELMEPFGDSHLKFEKAIHAVGGLEWAITDTIDVDIQGYYKYLYDLVNAVEDEESDRNYLNNAKGYVYGGEVMLRHKWTDRFFGWISYSISKSMRNDGPGTNYRPFDMDQRHNVVAVASWQFAKSWRLGGRFQFTSGEPYTKINGRIFNADNGTYLPVYDEDHKNNATRPAYHRLDLRLDKEWLFNTWVFHMYLDIENVYVHKNPIATIDNYDYTEQVYMTDVPILPSIGVSAEF